MRSTQTERNQPGGERHAEPLKTKSCPQRVHVTQVRSGSSWMGVKRRSVFDSRMFKRGPGQVCVGGPAAVDRVDLASDSHRWRLRRASNQLLKCSTRLRCLQANVDPISGVFARTGAHSAPGVRGGRVGGLNLILRTFCFVFTTRANVGA